jgi:hypothetical protein
MDCYILGIDIWVKIASRKERVKKKSIHFGIPISRSLINTIKRFLKAKRKVGVILDIAKRSLHVYLFLLHTKFPHY